VTSIHSDKGYLRLDLDSDEKRRDQGQEKKGRKIQEERK
jgi:hypothetical protein